MKVFRILTTEKALVNNTLDEFDDTSKMVKFPPLLYVNSFGEIHVPGNPPAPKIFLPITSSKRTDFFSSNGLTLFASQMNA